MEEIVVIFLELIFVYPGAFVRWILFYKGKKSLNEVAKDDLYKNSYIGILIIATFVGVLYSLV